MQKTNNYLFGSKIKSLKEVPEPEKAKGPFEEGEMKRANTEMNEYEDNGLD